ncbi:MAG TPA: hypothetical protein VJL10_00520 [Anaerolineales bacterium]|nr:hypothetical protein [Anaerolineales bacterium]
MTLYKSPVIVMGLLLYNFDYENPFAFFSDLKANDIRDGNMEVMLIRNMNVMWVYYYQNMN